MYTIYRITSPSGKCYIGLTKLKLADRWDAHCTRARRGHKHPFYAAFRKYGKDAFVLETLERTADLAAAKLAEIKWIAEYRSTERDKGYNISAGGDYDSESGKIAMAEKMRDPVFKARYIANLKAAQALREPGSWDKLVEGGQRWRRENAVSAYKSARRAARIATRAQGREWRGVPNVLPNTIATWGRLWIPGDKVRWARHTYFTKRHVTAKWAALDDAGRSELSRLISEGQKASFEANPERKAAVAEQLKTARANVDRKKQGAAASAGIKKYWADLKKDPVRYAEHQERRRATLIVTLKAKSDLRRRERGAEE